jgi:hypothetical protein
MVVTDISASNDIERRPAVRLSLTLSYDGAGGLMGRFKPACRAMAGLNL